MSSRFYCLLVLIVLILSLGGVSSRNFATNSVFADNDQGTVHYPKSLQMNQDSNEVTMKSFERVEEAAKYREVHKIGSDPPRCEHKCYGCMPCEPIQVPTTSSRVGVLYTNYEPEGWKCKCGPTFYSP